MSTAGSTQAERAAGFLELHHADRPLLLPNPWDQGSARLLASLGFQALATTSSGFAATLGRLDGQVTRDQALEHASLIAGATALPVSADLENGYADDPAGVADTVSRAIAAGLSGCSIEDFTRNPDSPIYDIGHAAERIAAAAEVAHRGSVHLVDWMLIASEAHLRRVLREYMVHYNEERPHRSRGLRPPSSRGDPAPRREGDTINRRARLGGILSAYYLGSMAA